MFVSYKRALRLEGQCMFVFACTMLFTALPGA